MALDWQLWIASAAVQRPGNDSAPYLLQSLGAFEDPIILENQFTRYWPYSPHPPSSTTWNVKSTSTRRTLIDTS